MSEEKSTLLSKMNWSILSAVFVMIGSVFVTYYKVDQLVDGQEIIEKNQVEMHADIDELKINVKDGDHALELKIKDIKTSCGCTIPVSTVPKLINSILVTSFRAFKYKPIKCSLCLSIKTALAFFTAFAGIRIFSLFIFVLFTNYYSSSIFYLVFSILLRDLNPLP